MPYSQTHTRPFFSYQELINRSSFLKIINALFFSQKPEVNTKKKVNNKKKVIRHQRITDDLFSFYLSLICEALSQH